LRREAFYVPAQVVWLEADALYAFEIRVFGQKIGLGISMKKVHAMAQG